MNNIEEAMEQWEAYGTVEGECDSCGHTDTVEPDGDYPCSECGEGRLQSPLIKYGMI